MLLQFKMAKIDSSNFPLFSLWNWKHYASFSLLSKVAIPFQFFLYFVQWDVQVKRFWLIRMQLSLLETRAWRTIAQLSGAGLKRIALMACRKIRPPYLKFLYASMPRLMKAVVDAQGGHTKYWICSLHVFVLSIE